MSKLLMGVFLLAGVALASSPVMARHDHANNSGGQSAEHMSAEGAENTNGAAAADRDKGQARAEDRTGEHGQPRKGGESHKHDKGGPDKNSKP